MGFEPLTESTRARPPAAAAISAHSSAVELSIHIGEVFRLSSGRICPTNGPEGDQPPWSAMGAFRYTEPCCCPAPLMPETRDQSKPWLLILESSKSSASTHISGS